jgi:hypothetical protein
MHSTTELSLLAKLFINIKMLSKPGAKGLKPVMLLGKLRSGGSRFEASLGK